MNIMSGPRQPTPREEEERDFMLILAMLSLLMSVPESCAIDLGEYIACGKSNESNHESNSRFAGSVSA